MTASDAAVQLLAEAVTIRRELGPDVRRSIVLATPDIGVPDGDVVATFTALATERARRRAGAALRAARRDRHDARQGESPSP